MSKSKIIVGYVGSVSSLEPSVKFDRVLKDSILFAGILRDVNLNFDKTAAYVIVSEFEDDNHLEIVGSDDIDLRKVEFIRAMDKVGVNINPKKPLRKFVYLSTENNDDKMYLISSEDI